MCKKRKTIKNKNNDMNQLGCILIASVLIMSCGGEKKNLAFNDSVEETSSDPDVISVPFEERGGVKYVDVTVNGLEFKMGFDSGSTDSQISIAEANYLYQKGRLEIGDTISTLSEYIVADGRIVENMVVNLNEVIIKGKNGRIVRCNNVRACVSANSNAPLILGNSVLDRVATYSVDNENKTINFKLK